MVVMFVRNLLFLKKLNLSLKKNISNKTTITPIAMIIGKNRKKGKLYNKRTAFMITRLSRKFPNPHGTGSWLSNF
jgi:hypothetical protein